MGKIAMNRSGHGTIEEDTMGEDTGISSGAFYELFTFPSLTPAASRLVPGHGSHLEAVKV
jgi:hypothetical protein